MTLVIALKVGDGLVLGADSASTLIDGKQQYHNSYFNAEKLFNLVKGLPVGLVTCGLGGLAGHSMGWHIKELREEMANPNSPYYVNPAAYTIGEIALKVRGYIYDDLYVKHITIDPDAPVLRFFVAGYSLGASSGEVWRISVQKGGVCDPPDELVPANREWDIAWDGQTEALHRLVMGWAPEIGDKLMKAGMSRVDMLNLLNSVSPIVDAQMPIQDAIDLVDYLVSTTCGFFRFRPGPMSVALPIDTAAITKLEGFRWVHRKHYYPRELNLPHPC